MAVSFLDRLGCHALLLHKLRLGHDLLLHGGGFCFQLLIGNGVMEDMHISGVGNRTDLFRGDAVNLPADICDFLFEGFALALILEMGKALSELLLLRRDKFCVLRLLLPSEISLLGEAHGSRLIGTEGSDVHEAFRQLLLLDACLALLPLIVALRLDDQRLRGREGR